MSQDRSSRRSFLQAAPAVVGAVALAGLEGEAPGQSGKSEHGHPSAPNDSAAMWKQEYWANRGDIKLYMLRKRLGAPRKGEARLPVLFLVHGSSLSSAGSFDVNVPGHSAYSLIDRFAGYGFDVWTMDFEGYGRSSASHGNSNVADGVEDLKAAVEIVAHETGHEKFRTIDVT
jgi:alpha-beta hydrolase superfamily lysophospholipase